MIINEKLKARRIELGMTMAEVAKIVGVSEATVSRWESGNIGNMKRDRIALYAKALKVSPTYIMGMGNEEENEIFNAIVNDTLDNQSGAKRLKNAEQIKTIRNHYKITRKQLGRIAGVNEDTITDWENAAVKIPADKIGIICQYFNINASDFYDTDRVLTFEKAVDPTDVVVLSLREYELLYYFELLNEEGQSAIISTALAFSGMPQYKKCDTDSKTAEDA